uniref:C6 zinc finger domain-containing protein n=1 Tax=Colletotrichum scovillei TaxID=1209932 RepID=A0A9P7QRL8_9PEZI
MIRVLAVGWQCYRNFSPRHKRSPAKTVPC